MDGPLPNYVDLGGNSILDLEAALGAHITKIAGVAHTDGDPVAVQNWLNAYHGSAAELASAKVDWQTLLDTQFDQHFDLAKFIRGGTVTTVTAAQVGSFLAQITNNYRSLRASIAAATTVAAVQAINIAAGWPSNP